MKEPSEEFRRAVGRAGSCHILCEYCGRVHFSSAGGFDFEEGELEELLEKAEKEPDKYFDHGLETPAWGNIDGKQAVVDCPCNGLRRFEDWIWNHRFIIMDYLDARTRKMVEEADWERKQYEKIKVSDQEHPFVGRKRS